MDQISTTITMLGNATLSFIELYVESKKHNVDVGDLFNKVCTGL